MTFTEILDHFSVPYRRYGEHHHCTSGWVQVDCPYCSKGYSKFRLGYNLRQGNLACWTCGGLRFNETLKELINAPYAQIKGLLSELSKEDLPEEIDKRGNLVLPDKLGPLQKPHKQFLQRRKLDPDEIQEIWKIQGIGHTAELFWRIFIPIHFKEEVVSWTTRSVKDKTRFRYLAAQPEQERYNHRDLLYGEANAGNSCVVVEGPTDVWKIGPGAVATFGTAYRRSQVARISRFPVRFIWLDAAAIRRAERLVADLETLPGVTYLVKSKAKDPGSAPMSEIREIRKRIS